MPNITYLFARAEANCSVRICVNGFPVIHGPLFANTEVFDIIGENLVLGENELTAALDVSPRAKVAPSSMPISVALEIRHFQPGGVVCPEEGEKVPLRQVEPQELLAAPEVNALLTLMPDAQAMVFRYLFEGSDQDLGRFLKQPARPVDPEILKDYGYFLQQLFAANDVSRFMTHYAPKLEAMAKARLRPVPDVLQEFGAPRRLGTVPAAV